MERVGAVQTPAFDHRLALSDEGEGQVRERREITARANRAARRYDREDAAIEALDEQLDRLDSRSREASSPTYSPQQHGPANDLVRVRLTDSACMAAQEA